MISRKLLQQNPQRFKNLTGISMDDFDGLLGRMMPIWDEGEKARLARPNRQRTFGGGRAYGLDLPDQLLMTLIWRHLCLSTEAMGFIFGVDKSTVSRNTRRMWTTLTALDPMGWPASRQRRHGKNIEQALTKHPDLQAIVDEAAQISQSSHPIAPSVDPTDLIARTALFQGLSPAALDEVRQAAYLRHVERQGFFHYQDDPATDFYILMEGQVRLSEVTPEGYQVLVRFVSPGEAIGIIAVLRNKVYPLAAQALEECRALAWDGKTLEKLMERFPRIAINGLRLVSQRWHEVEERYRELATERVERRVAQSLLRLVRQVGRREEDGVLIDLPLTRQDLADMTGTTHYTISRIFSRWENEKIIETGRGRILICYPHGLARIAEDLPPEETDM